MDILSQPYLPPSHVEVNPVLTPALAASHLQHRVVLEAEAFLQQAGDVGHVHAEEGADGTELGHLVAHCEQEQVTLCHTAHWMTFTHTQTPL